MASLPSPVTPGFPDVYQIETLDRVKGGPGGTANLQATQLVERTAFLKNQIDNAVSGALKVMYANRLTTARNIAMTGDGSWNVTFDGNGNVTAAMTLTNTAVVPGTWPMTTIDSKGRVTAGRALVEADIPALSWAKITSGKPTTLAGYGITDAQPLDSDLTALAALTTTGFYVNTGVGTVAARTLTAGVGISISNGDGVAGNPTVALAASGVGAGTYPKVTVDTYGRVTAGAALAAADIPALDWSKIASGKPTTLGGYGITDAQALNSQLTAISGLAANGLIVRTAAGTAAARTLTAGAGISVTNGDGITGNPTFALADSGVTAGTYPKVTVDRYGRATGGAALTPADIPPLDFSKITSGLPTTLAGYGIVDALSISKVVTAVKDATFTDNGDTPVSSSWIRGAIAAIATAAGFAFSSSADSGYVRLPSWLGGWMAQWGVTPLPPVGNFNSAVVGGTSYYTHFYQINFPVAFPTAQYVTLVSLAGSSANSQSNEFGSSVRSNRGTTSGTPSLAAFTASVTTTVLGLVPIVHWVSFGR